MEPKAPHTDLCPNSGQRFSDLTAAEHTESGCLLGLLVGVVREREVVALSSTAVASFEDVDGLWDRWGGPAADQLEDAMAPSATTSGAPGHESSKAKER